MMCLKPLQAGFSVREDGKKDIYFSDIRTRLFYKDYDDYHTIESFKENTLSLPCGQCMACRLERSRQTAVRAMHEASMFSDNSFITLTFSPDGLSQMCPTGSLDKRHMQLFMKRLRKYYDDRRIRTLYCGEYGDKLGRPHYHAALFNLDFPDKTYWKSVNGFKYYTSEQLREIWPYGFNVIGDLTFESAAYIARYCTKKITGDKAEEYYKKVLADTGEVVRVIPEFAQSSNRPGLGAEWFDKYGMTDVYPRDECVVRGQICKPPRYYDKLLERVNPEMFLDVKKRRDEKRRDMEDDNTYLRLLAKERCMVARMKKLVRRIEQEAYA